MDNFLNIKTGRGGWELFSILNNGRNVQYKKEDKVIKIPNKISLIISYREEMSIICYVILVCRNKPMNTIIEEIMKVFNLCEYRANAILYNNSKKLKLTEHEILILKYFLFKDLIKGLPGVFFEDKYVYTTYKPVTFDDEIKTDSKNDLIPLEHKYDIKKLKKKGQFKLLGQKSTSKFF